MSDLDDLPLAECQQYLLAISDPDYPALGENLTEREFQEILQQCKLWSNTKSTTEEREIIPKYVAKVLSTLINTTSLDGKCANLPNSHKSVTNFSFCFYSYFKCK